MRVNVKRLVEVPVRKVFNSHLQINYLCIPGEVGDMKSDWAIVKASIAETAANSCFLKAIGVFTL